MNCPVCVSENLVLSERQGIEIDYCPKCRGVWLDRGELDKIIERNADQQPAGPVPQAPPQQPVYQQAPPPPYPQQPYPPQPYPQHRDHYEHRKHYHKKRKSWLDELFD